MGAIEFRGFSYQDFLNKYASSVLKIMTKVGIISIFTQIFFSSCQKVWVLAPTTLKSMGDLAPTAPILTLALQLGFKLIT